MPEVRLCEMDQVYIVDLITGLLKEQLHKSQDINKHYIAWLYTHLELVTQPSPHLQF